MSGLFRLRLLERHAVGQLHRRPAGARRDAPNPTYHVYDVNAAVGGPIIKDKLWYYMSVRRQGSAAEHPERLLQPERWRSDEWTYAPDFNRPAYLRSAVGELHAADHVAGDAEEQNHVLVGRTAGVPTCTGTAAFSGSPLVADGAGSGRPRRVQPTARPDGALDVTGDEQAAPRSRSRQHLLPVGRPRARSESDPGPDSRDRKPGGDRPPGAVAVMRYRSQNWLINKTERRQLVLDGVVHHRVAQHEVRLPGQLVARRPRDARQRPEPVVHLHRAACRLSLTEYANPYN